VFPKRRPIKTINTTQHQSGYIASNWTTHSSNNRSTDSTITLTGIPTLALVTIEFIYYELEDGLSCHNDSTMLVDTNSSCSLTIITHSGEDECLNLNSTHKTWSYLIVNETLSFSYKADGRCKQSYKGFLFRYTGEPYNKIRSNLNSNRILSKFVFFSCCLPASLLSNDLDYLDHLTKHWLEIYLGNFDRVCICL